jgi:hypothetical protein
MLFQETIMLIYVEFKNFRMKGYFYQDKVGCFKYRTLCIAWRLMLLGRGIRLSSKKEVMGMAWVANFNQVGFTLTHLLI